jgi:hypothetical protein
MTATRIRSIGRCNALVAAYALVFNVVLTSTLLATISPSKASAIHELCLNGGPAVPDADGSTDSGKPIVRCPLFVQRRAMADQPPQTPASRSGSHCASCSRHQATIMSLSALLRAITSRAAPPHLS